MKALGGIGLAAMALVAVIFGGVLWYLSNNSICEPCLPCEGLNAINPLCTMPHMACQSAYMACQGVEGFMYFVLLGFTVLLVIAMALVVGMRLVGKRFSFKALLVPSVVAGLFILLILMVLVDMGLSLVGLIPGVGDGLKLASEPVLEMAELVLIAIIVLVSGGASVVGTEAVKKS